MLQINENTLIKIDLLLEGVPKVSQTFLNKQLRDNTNAGTAVGATAGAGLGGFLATNGLPVAAPVSLMSGAGLGRVAGHYGTKAYQGIKYGKTGNVK